MPLMITKKSVDETQADMVIIIREKEKQSNLPKGSIFPRFTQELRATDSKRPVLFVDYPEENEHATFDKNYEKVLDRAVRHGCETVAVSCEDKAAFALVNQFSKRFAEEKDIQITLCISEDMTPSSSSIEKLRSLFSAFGGKKQTPPKHSREAIDPLFQSAFEPLCMPIAREPVEPSFHPREEDRRENCGKREEIDFAPAPMPQATAPTIQSKAPETEDRGSVRHKEAKGKPKADYRSLQKFLKQNDAGFKDTLIKYIDRSGKKDSEIYKKANVDRRLFSKILNVQGYNPSKPTAIAFAIALELNLEETRDLISRAGYALSHASTFDRIIEFFILERNYDIYEINEALFYFDQSLLGC